MMSPNNALHTFQEDLKSITSLESLYVLETQYLGKNGILNESLKSMKDLDPEARKVLGQEVNKIKGEIVESISIAKKKLLSMVDENNAVDVTLPGKKYESGSLHLVTYAIEEISAIFERIGFIRMSYPEIEWEWFSFEALNMPADHPARDDFETFFIDTPAHEKFGKMVLTPHTSSGQIREMLRLGKPPIRMINIAKTYRPNWDASHVPMFHQFEGLCIDKKINITHLKGTIDYFAKEFFGEDRETRLRPFHFQFTEPSFEVDITCDLCAGTGYVSESGRSLDSARDDLKVKCKLCKQGWLELGGTGMVHPNVLTAGGIDPKEYTGWAFGFGVERVMMMKPGVGLNNMRALYDGDIRVLEQF
ncbi:phenylalanine--tRNA ligase subunit alpha [Candidatus Roizmanbacteria bacterium CG_4_10_14_0_2_um_filter_39_13]|uniref:Phenylalanine--tRNA ligase alpha subunit n=1 Tax=Candidatus Roizmanbacteria bacterium CG_4_10_14_0_2_um_filter_39_13 TaxID=1974825 RepID=A0A2M7U1Z7_9BACT|nr:MAG: phenylalanine--tRNA ligase subunit alpha [Candidatus Roizmanbacteria bacterium CG_4_10_14_0_2_um_filter_39_13]